MTKWFSQAPNRTAETSLFVGWFLLMLFGYGCYRGFQLDDMFITLRYARNFATGEGFAFNSGETYYGFTSALHFFAMAMVYLLCPWNALFPDICVFAGCLNLWILAILVYLIARESGKPEWGVLGGTLLLSSEHLYATIGLDPIWCLTLAMAGLFAEYRKHHLLAALLIGLATLARPDAVILASLLFGRRLLLERSSLWRAVLIYGCVVLSWHGFAWLYFGHPLPQTLGAKINQGVTSSHFSRELLFPWLYPSHFFPLNKGFLLIPLGILGLLQYRKDHPFTLFSVWSLLHTILYFHFLKVPTDYPWYYVLPSVSTIILLGIGVLVLARLLGSILDTIQRISKQQTPVFLNTFWTTKVLKGGIVVAVAIGLLFSWVETSAAYRQGRSSLYHYWSAGQECREAGIWIREHTPEDIVVMAGDIGAVGYYSERYIYDLCELIHSPSTRTRAYGGYEFFRMYPDQGFESLLEQTEGACLETVEFTHRSNPPAVFIKRLPSETVSEPSQPLQYADRAPVPKID